VRLFQRLGQIAYRPHLPRWTVRLRLTLLYGLLFLFSGAALLVVTNALVRQGGGGSSAAVVFNNPAGPAPNGNMTVGPVQLPASNSTGAGFASGSASGISPLTPQQLQVQGEQIKGQLKRQHNNELHQLLVYSGMALAAMAALSIALGWIVAGRVLRPLRTITAAARDISASNLNARIPTAGPDDELKELGNTFNQLLARLEKSFEAQRRFVANASHELRTPLTRQRALAQVALADPDADVDTLRAAHERVLASGAQQERLIDALLTLARGEAGLARREPVELSAVTEGVLGHADMEIQRLGVTCQVATSPAPLIGDPRLVDRLVANLVDNAIRHNVPGGLIEVSTRRLPGGQAVLSVSNTGPVVPVSELDRLFQPFQRLVRERTAQGDGVGLGLSIVRAIATAHGAAVTATNRPQGGLTIQVAFPPVPASADHDLAPSLGGNGNRDPESPAMVSSLT
jgi:signal transduction histidine kinase